LACHTETNFPVEQVVRIIGNNSQKAIQINNRSLNNSKSCILCFMKEDQAITYGIFSAAMELLSSCVFFFSNNRAYYILVGNHPTEETWELHMH
jgi:hypothetical protein